MKIFVSSNMAVKVIWVHPRSGIQNLKLIKIRWELIMWFYKTVAPVEKAKIEQVVNVSKERSAPVLNEELLRSVCNLDAATAQR